MVLSSALSRFRDVARVSAELEAAVITLTWGLSANRLMGCLECASMRYCTDWDPLREAIRHCNEAYLKVTARSNFVDADILHTGLDYRKQPGFHVLEDN